MKKWITLAAFVATGFLAGCETSTQTNAIRIGMTKADVISVLGQPDSTAAQGNAEYFTYYLYVADDNRDQPYLVRFVDGKVESFGRFAQLYDLYNRPVAGGPQGPNPGVNPMTMLSPSGNPMMATSISPVAVAAPDQPADLATEIARLKTLEDQGVITAAEFEQAKAKLLAPSK